MRDYTDLHPGVIGVLVLIFALFLWWYTGPHYQEWMRECLASGNTKRFCELSFWRVR